MFVIEKLITSTLNSTPFNDKMVKLNLIAKISFSRVN